MHWTSIKLPQYDQRSNISKVIAGISSENKEKVTELQMGVTKPSAAGVMSCQCKSKQIQLGETDKISGMLKELINSAKEGKAKIKIEIEFSD